MIFPEPRVGIVEAPFHASAMLVGINFPCGGFRVTSDMQVINVFGEPIAGLFAVGDCAGGLSCTIGLGGMRLTGALATGRIAGRAIATDSVQAAAVAGLTGAAALPSTAMKIPLSTSAKASAEMRHVPPRLCASLPPGAVQATEAGSRRSPCAGQSCAALGQARRASASAQRESRSAATDRACGRNA